LKKAAHFEAKGLKAKDALHISCAIETNCDYILTTDYHIQKKMANVKDILVVNPIGFIDVITEVK
jgi:predicted nucleic acid-binding protein